MAFQFHNTLLANSDLASLVCKWEQAAEQEVLHDWKLGQHFHLVHLDHTRVDLQQSPVGNC